MREMNLINALSTVFSKNDALLLAKLFQDNLEKDIIHYGEIDIEESQKDNLILLSFEERILIPLKSRSGPAWEDKLLDFENNGQYFIPPVVKAIVETMCETGKPSCDTAVKRTLLNQLGEDISGFIELLRKIMKHANNHIFETGLLEIFLKETAMNRDLHDVIDIFVICSIMSPCPQKSLMTGLSWYEINSTLYWDKAFLS